MGTRFKLGDDLGPQLAEFMETVMGFIEAARPHLTRIAERLIFVADQVLTALTKALLLVDIVESGMVLILSGIKEAKDGIGDVLELVGGLAGSIIKNLLDGGGIFDVLLQFVPSLDEAMDAFQKAIDRFAGGVDKLIEDRLTEGNKIASALFTAFQQWGNSASGHGQQVTDPVIRGVPDPTGTMVRDVVPGIGDVPNTALPLEEFLRRQQAGVGRFPRVSDAAMHLHVADNATIQAGDEDRLHAELLQWKDQILGEVRGMMDARWMRLAAARAALPY